MFTLRFSIGLDDRFIPSIAPQSTAAYLPPQSVASTPFVPFSSKTRMKILLLDSRVMHKCIDAALSFAFVEPAQPSTSD
jgi:hypothetical protein